MLEKKEKISRESMDTFREVKVPCITRQWWIHVIIYLSKSMDTEDSERKLI